MPEEKKWWLKYPASNPKVIDTKKVSLEFVDNLIKTDRFKLTISEKKRRLALV